jgi:filamentous hemagglutinin family protein
MKTCTTLPLATLIPLLATSAHAEVTLDGSLGRPGALPGPNYQIGADLGQQHGGNLFHSFRDFNLQSHESATFSGPANVQNIISRVTGGNPSSIDGTLRSTIPNADMYFLNPYGIMFGPNAKLDVQGSFHASTADTLQLQDGGEFNARIPTKGLLTVAPPSAFGFLTDSPAALSLQDSQLTVPYGQTFSLTGGNLSLTGAQVNAPGGQVTLSSLAQTGQISLANPTLSGKGGTIGLQNQSKVSTSGIGGGKVLIRGGQLVMDNSAIEAATLGNQDGKGIDIATSESVTTTGDVFAINAPTFGSGKGGDISITTSRLENTGGYIDTNSLGSGASGNIDVQANQVTLQAGGSLDSLAFSSGDGGLIRVTAEDSVTVAGHRTGDFDAYGILLRNFSSHISVTSHNTGRTGKIEITTPHLSLDEGLISMATGGLTDAQSIIIEANSVTLKNGGFINSDTFGDHAGGNITLRVAGDLTIMGRKSTVTIFPFPFNVEIEAMQSAISSSTLGKGSAGHITISANRLMMQEGAIGTVSAAGTGPAGQIQITVNQLQLDQGGSIASSSGFLFGQTLLSGTGDGGEVQVEVAGDLRIHGRNFLGIPSNISSNTLTTGRGGNVTVRANHLQLSDGGLITANSLGAGDAGELTIQANTLEIFDQGQITTAAQYAGGGDIHLTAANLLYLRQGQLTTSVASGIGNGGNITLDHPQFVVMNHGRIIAQADAGHGGNIRIVADQFLKTPDSLVSASSRLGINGQVRIDSPDQTIGNSLLAGANTINAVPNLLPRPCEWASFEEYLNRSTFYVYPLAGSSLSPYDLKPSHAFRSFPTLPTAGQATVSKERRAGGSQRLAWLTGCHQ